MNLIKNTVLFGISLVVCFSLLIIGDWYITRQINEAFLTNVSLSDARKIEDIRHRNEDIPQREEAVLQGFLPTIYPSLMDSFDLQYPLIAGLPSTKTYYCNEGYGLMRYRSDRFGFRNEDWVWDKDPKELMIGDSFVHGACVSKESTLPRKLSGFRKTNIINLGFGGNSPSHYYTYAHLFIPKIKPKVVYLNFYANDNGVRSKSIIERRYIDEEINIFSENNIAFYDGNVFAKVGYQIIAYIQDQEKISNSVQKLSFVQRSYKAFKRHSTLPALRSIFGQNSWGGFYQTERVVTQTLELCIRFNCKLLVSFIPNSEYSLPDPRADRYGDQIAELTDKLGVSFIDGREFIDRGKDSLDFAIKGPHLSPLGYEKMAKAIANSVP
jgi:hypothetical protein